MMKLILFLVISCVALHNGKGAPITAVYKFVRCNPDGDQANCVTQRGPEMAWSPDLPAKLPALTAQYLEAEPEEELKMDEGESSVMSADGSGAYEGSAATSMADLGLGETGSGESWAEKDGKQYKDDGMRGMRRLFPSWPLVGKAKPGEEEMSGDHLLQL